MATGKIPLHPARERGEKQVTKSQAALEYLVTYGWALVAIATIIGLLAFVGSSSAGTATCTAFIQFICKGVSIDAEGNLVIVLQNATSQRIVISPTTGIMIGGEGAYAIISFDGIKFFYDAVIIEPGQEFTIIIPGAIEANQLTLEYQDQTDLNKTVTSAFRTGKTIAETAAASQGTTGNLHEISTPEGLQNMRNDLAGYYYLAGNIDMTGINFTPIGTETAPFTGTLDGTGHVVTGLSINRPSGSYIGLIGRLGNNGTVKNIVLRNATINGGNNVGGLVGESNAGTTISYAVVEGTVSANDSGLKNKNGIGLLAGRVYGTVDNCHSAGTASIVGDGWGVGGLVGDLMENGRISDSFSTATVNAGGPAFSAGGLAGIIRNGSNVTGSRASGNIETSNQAGGLVGESYGGTIRDSYATGAVSISGNSAGGLLGHSRASPITIKNCYATGNVTASGHNAGGLAGHIQSGATITNCHATGATAGRYGVGGLVGRVENPTASISKSYATGNATATDVQWGYYVGGVVGMNDGKISDCYARGTARGVTYIGGFVGYNINASISKSYSTGRIISSGTNKGGFAGSNSGTLCQNSFWDTQTSLQSASACATGRTTVQMQTPGTFTNVGWDPAVWNLADGSYPTLK
jgi:hypothetical protein